MIEGTFGKGDVAVVNEKLDRVAQTNDCYVMEVTIIDWNSVLPCNSLSTA